VWVISDSVESVKAIPVWTDLFIGVIVIALIGNMAALFSAVKMARKNRMDLSFETGMSAMCADFPAGCPCSRH
jgi:Ca2+:H+ antiporter